MNWNAEIVRKEVKVMPQNKVDRRVQKTRKLLQDALIELVAEKGYESITIQEILDKANVGRSTFYAHSQDKDQLLNSILDRLDELFDGHKKQLLDATQNVGNAGNTDSIKGLSPTLSLFQFVGQNHRFFKAMLGIKATVYSPSLSTIMCSLTYTVSLPGPSMMMCLLICMSLSKC